MSRLHAVTTALAQVQAEYAAALPSRFRRTRTRLWGSADAHYLNPFDYGRMREYVRDMDRNDGYIGPLVDQLFRNIGPLKYVPMTGDKGLDRELRARMDDWRGDQSQCSLTGRFAFADIEKLTDRHEIIDGDCFVILLEDGCLQCIEPDLVTSPMNQQENVIHGVELNEFDRPTGYWFVKPRKGAARFGHDMRIPVGRDHYDVRPARDENGDPVILHIFDPVRFSQNRGVTAFHAVFDVAGMAEDLNFAKLIQAQMVSCIAAFIKKTGDFQSGARTTETQSDGSSQILEEITPGSVPRLKPGEDIAAFSPNVPNAEFFEHMRFLMRMISISVGMPLTLGMNDTTNTTFHGYRGELSQARIGFDWKREIRERRLNRPVARWKIRSWLPELGAAAQKLGPAVYRHKWVGKAYPYVEPKTDAEADKIRLDNLMVSPRDYAAERGEEWEDIVTETVEDRTLLIDLAADAAKKLSQKHGIEIGWRDLVNLAPPAGLQGAVGPQAKPGEAPKPEGEKPASKKTAALEAVALEAVAALRAKAEQAAPPVTVNVNVAEGAVQSTTSVTVPEREVNVNAPVDARTSIAEGAVRVEAPVDARTTVEAGAVQTTVQPSTATIENNVTAVPGELAVSVEAKLPPRSAEVYVTEEKGGKTITTRRPA